MTAPNLLSTPADGRPSRAADPYRGTDGGPSHRPGESPRPGRSANSSQDDRRDTTDRTDSTDRVDPTDPTDPTSSTGRGSSRSTSVPPGGPAGGGDRSTPQPTTSREVDPKRGWRDDTGMSTVEYAIGVVAAAAFAAILYTVLSGESVVAALTGLVERALSTEF